MYRTVDQLAREVGVPVEVVGICCAEGLMAEPDLAPGGQQRYGDQHAAQLRTVRTLAEAGLTAAGIRHLAAAGDDELDGALARLDRALGARLQGLQRAVRRSGPGPEQAQHPVPAEVLAHAERLGRLGFSERWTAAELRLWTTVFATQDEPLELFRARVDALSDDAVAERHRDYDMMLELEPHRALLAPGAGVTGSRSAPSSGDSASTLVEREASVRDTRRRLRQISRRQVRQLRAAQRLPSR